MNPQLMNNQINNMANFTQGAYAQFVPLKQLLTMIPGISCKEQPNYAEAFVGCDFENKYYFFEKRVDKNKAVTNIPLFKAKEKSNFCARQCCGNATRPF